jgi:hypothetical protein
MSDPRTRLAAYLNQGLLPDLVRAYEALGLLRAFGEYSEVLREGSRVLLFESLQRALYEQYVLAVAKMFDRPRGYELRSIPQALDLIRSNATVLRIEQRPNLLLRLERAGMDISAIGGLSDPQITEALVAFFDARLPTPDSHAADPLCRYLDAVKVRRDKMVAHNEHVSSDVAPNLRWSEAEELVRFAEQFLSAVSFGYTSLVIDSGSDQQTFLRTDAERAAHQLRILLWKAGLIPDPRLGHHTRRCS